jgi:hypothetical protein
LAIAVLPLLLTACFSITPTFSGDTNPDPLVDATLYLSGSDTYVYQRSGGDLAISAAATNTSEETRQAYFPENGPLVAAEQSCETWTSATSGGNQQGIALRVAPTVDGLGTRAITVTKNVIYGVWWTFNVHVWDSTSSHPFTLIGQFNESSILRSNIIQNSDPWHVCARVDGSLFQFIVWSGTNQQPSWDDASAVQQVTLPAGWDYPGRAGWYIGHLNAGDVDTFTDMQTWSLTGAIVPPTTSTTTTSSPDTTTSVPDTTTSVPDTTTSIPDTTTSIPDTTTSIPDTTTSLPDTTSTTLAGP